MNYREFDREIAEIRGQLYDMQKECLSLTKENIRLRQALDKIASEDYRGNQPSSIRIARAALEEK